MTSIRRNTDLGRSNSLPWDQKRETEATRTRRIGFLIFPEVEMLDLCGPMDVFVQADNWRGLTGSFHEREYELSVIGKMAGPVKSAGGLQFIADYGFDDVFEEFDTLIIPGSPFIKKVCEDEALIEWLKNTAPRARRIVSVCTGALLLAAAGLLTNRRATTHWMYCDQLAAGHPSISMDRDRIYVRDGNVYTSGGITAGIDLALALIEEDLGCEAARFVAGLMVMFLRRPGGQNQFSTFLQAQARSSRPDFRELQAWIVANPNEDLGVEGLAERVGMSPRNFSRLFHDETGMSPAKFVEYARLEAARCKLEQTELLMEAIAEATGFGSAERMQRSFQRLLTVTPRDYRARFRSVKAKWGSRGTRAFSAAFSRTA
jgi:transcriptional regulator GlxA family with amidase domain